MTGKKKLLFLEYFPFMGGGQKVLLDLIAGLKMHYDIEALVMNHGMMEAALEKNRVKTHFLQAPGKVKYRYFNQYLPFFIKLNRFLKENKYDLVYSGSLFASKLLVPPLFASKLFASSLFGSKLINPSFVLFLSVKPDCQLRLPVGQNDKPAPG